MDVITDEVPAVDHANDVVQARARPAAIGVVPALTVHLGETGTRGAAAPVLSTAEDRSSGLLVGAAILLPALVAVLLVALIVELVLLMTTAHRHRSRRRAAPIVA